MKRSSKLKGQATFEFVLVLPILLLLLCGVADYAHVAREDATVQSASSEGARYAAANPNLSNDEIAAYVREAYSFGTETTVTVTSAEAPAKKFTLQSGQGSVAAKCSRENVKVKVSRDVKCIFPLGSLGIKGATDDGWLVSSETDSVRSTVERQ